jgi:hypothetical protein
VPAIRLTHAQRAAVTALASPYLEVLPDYDPRPRTCADVAAALGVSEGHVIERVRQVRHLLVSAGVLPPTAEADPRRTVCEWLLALGLVTAADLDWLRARISTRDSAAAPEPVGAPSNLPTTTHPVHDEITHIAEDTARWVAPSLLRHLRDRYGDNWLEPVNRARRRSVPQRQPHLRDYRFCLGVLGSEAVTGGWADDACRQAARALNGLANRAAHRRTLMPADVEQARAAAETIRRHVPSGPVG